MVSKRSFLILVFAVCFPVMVMGVREALAVDLLEGFKQLEGEISVSTARRVGRVNPDVYGLFTEMCFFEFNQGVWAEMLRHRKFEAPDGEDAKYGVVRHWYAIGKNDKTYFMHDNTVYYTGSQSQKIISENAANKRTGIGQGKLYFEQGKGYYVRVNLRQEGLTGAVTIALEGEDKVYASKQVSLDGSDWQRFSFTLESTQTDKDGKFTITFSGGGTLWVGSASLMPTDNIFGFRKDVVRALIEMKPPNIRWPGGNMVSVYRWKEGIGDRDKRPSRHIRGLWDPYDVGIDEFMALCKAVGTKPYIALNAGDGRAEEAAAWVEYCNGSAATKYGKLRAENGHPEPYNIELWGIGNEMFGNWQNGHVDEETYARRHVAIAKAIRAVDKDIKIVASGARPWKYPRWNKALLKIAGDYLDYISLHSYAKKYRGKMQKEDLKDSKFAKEFYYYIVSSPYGIEEQIAGTDKEIRETLPNRPDIKVAFDEWNCWAYRPPGKEFETENVDFALRDALYTAGTFHAFRRQHKALSIANFSKMVNAMPLIKVSQSGMFLNPQYLAFKMYLNHQGPILLGTDVKCDSYAAPDYEKNRPQAKGQIPYLDASATISEDGKAVYLAIINLHISKSIKAKISFDKWDFSSEVKVFELYDDDYMAENTFEKPNRLGIKEGLLKDVGDSYVHNFKPHSVTIMEFRRK
jgi:alpha-N-arabinofuranosidase